MEQVTQAWGNNTADLSSYAPAMLKAQKAIENAVKGSKNPHFRNTYADLNAVLAAVKGPLNENGILIQQFASSADGLTVDVTTQLLHESGQYMTSTLRLKPSKADPQGIGSAITYGRRYTLSAMCGLGAEDDDGNEASGHRQQPQRTVPMATDEQKRDLKELLDKSPRTDEEFAKAAKHVGCASLNEMNYNHYAKLRVWLAKSLEVTPDAN